MRDWAPPLTSPHMFGNESEEREGEGETRGGGAKGKVKRREVKGAGWEGAGWLFFQKEWISWIISQETK
jgi:hypothetical protein